MGWVYSIANEDEDKKKFIPAGNGDEDRFGEGEIGLENHILISVPSCFHV